MLIKKYPYLNQRFGNSDFFTISHLYEIDLSEAEEKVKYCEINGGTEENDIWIDVVGSISDWLENHHHKSLDDFVMENMDNWGYTEGDDWKEQRLDILAKLHTGDYFLDSK